MDPDLKKYVIAYFSHLMTSKERQAYFHLVITMKATNGHSDLSAQQEVRAHKVRSKWLSNDPEVLRLATDGYEVFVERTAHRILAEQSNQVFLKCCPKCGVLARTPTAKQCRACRHDWHQI